MPRGLGCMPSGGPPRFIGGGAAGGGAMGGVIGDAPAPIGAACMPRCIDPRKDCASFDAPPGATITFTVVDGFLTEPPRASFSGECFPPCCAAGLRWGQDTQIRLACNKVAIGPPGKPGLDHHAPPSAVQFTR